MILGTAGHIDHGKTALVRALTGVDTDRLPEEKRRGITIDLGFAPLAVEGIGTIGIVDVPGHEAFIRTMLAGASGIDIALLVIAADEGVMPQTHEHLEILKLLGVRRGLVALTKSDLVDGDWLEFQVDEVESFLSRATLETWKVIPVSARTGAGIDELRSAIALEAKSIPARDAASDLFRMPVDRAFTVKGTGTVVTGTVWSGSVSRDASLIVQPTGRLVRVKGIEHHGSAADSASAGQRTALALAGVGLSEVQRGSVLVSESEWVASSEIKAVIELNRDDLRITPRTRMLFHLGTAEVEARLVIDGTLEAAGEKVGARVHLAEPVVSRTGDHFVLRMPSPARTVGGGTVVDPYPPQRSRRRRSEKYGHEETREIPRRSRLELLLEDAGVTGASNATLPVRTGMSPDLVAIQLGEIGAIRVGTNVYSRHAGETLMKRIESIVAEEVANHPLEPGVSLQATRSAAGATDELVGWAIQKLVEAGRIEIAQSLVRPAGWKPSIGEADQALTDSIMHEICKQPSEPPSIGELEAKFGGKTRPLVRKLERDGRLERVSDDRYYSSEAVAEIVNGMRSRLDTGRTYSPAELREVLGVSRKYLIPFLEFCDRTGVTERRQDGRAVRPLAGDGSK